MGAEAIVLPMVVLVATGIAYFLILKQIDNSSLALTELGSVYVMVVMAYSLFPPLSYIVNGLRISSNTDPRLIATNPGIADVASMTWNYATYLAFFALGYLLLRMQLPQPRPKLTAPRQSTAFVLVLFYVLIKLYFFCLELFYALPQATNYWEMNTKYRGLPLFQRQLTNHLGGSIFTLNVLILTYLMWNYAKNRMVIFGWLGFELALTFASLGSRTELVLLLLCFFILRHVIVKPLTITEALGLSVTGGVLFLVLGLLRLSAMTGIQFGVGDMLTGVFAYNNEFDGLFATAIHVRALHEVGFGNDIQTSLYFGDFLKLIPQQFLSIEKISPLEWYANTFFPEYVAAGGGFAFGAIPEAMLGSGIVDVVWRATALGMLYACAHSFCLRGNVSFLRFGFYVWLTVFSFSAFRDTTFALLSMSVFRYLPVAIALGVFEPLLKAVLRRDPGPARTEGAAYHQTRTLQPADSTPTD